MSLVWIGSGLIPDPKYTAHPGQAREPFSISSCCRGGVEVRRVSCRVGVCDGRGGAVCVCAWERGGGGECGVRSVRRRRVPVFIGSFGVRGVPCWVGVRRWCDSADAVRRGDGGGVERQQCVRAVCWGVVSGAGAGDGVRQLRARRVLQAGGLGGAVVRERAVWQRDRPRGGVGVRRVSCRCMRGVAPRMGACERACGRGTFR